MYRVVPPITHFGSIAPRIPLVFSCRPLNISLTASRNQPAYQLSSSQSPATPGSGCVLVRSGPIALAGAHPLRSRFSYCHPQPPLSRHCFYSSSSTARPTQHHPASHQPSRCYTSPPRHRQWSLTCHQPASRPACSSRRDRRTEWDTVKLAVALTWVFTLFLLG